MKLSETSGTLEKTPNVVPMIDVLLVLLIIFMMQVSLQRKAMDVQVPPENVDPSEQPPPETQIVLELMPDGTYQINKEPVPKNRLSAKFHEIYDNRPAKILFVKTAPTRRYGDLVEAMDIARGAGVQVIGYTPTQASAE